jgi:hypothetical protein
MGVPDPKVPGPLTLRPVWPSQPSRGKPGRAVLGDLGTVHPVGRRVMAGLRGTRNLAGTPVPSKRPPRLGSVAFALRQLAIAAYGSSEKEGPLPRQHVRRLKR